MAKLYYFYGAMGSAKTANALITEYNYRERGQHPLLVKTDLDTRDGKNIIRSRLNIQAEATPMSFLTNQYNYWGKELFYRWIVERYQVVIVDEIQFATTNEIDMLAEIVDQCNIPVLCYGLRTNFKGQLFEASARLMGIADEIAEIKTMCWCGRKATFSARLDSNGNVTKKGHLIEMGGNNKYISLCRKHFLENKPTSDAP